MATALVCLLAMMLDRVFGEPRRAHPLVAFGRFSAAVERALNRTPWLPRAKGVLAVMTCVGPPVAMAVWVSAVAGPLWLAAFEVLGLWLAVAASALAGHARAVVAPLRAGDLAAARSAVAALVSRDSAAMSPDEIAAAATESVLENGGDAVFASLFWFVVAGLPGVVAHRCVNTLDALWGYRTPRFENFGMAAARLDDLLNWPVARLTALTYALLGQTRAALWCWRRQAPLCSSPNAGPVMAAGAGALGVALGGPAHYHGRWRYRPRLGHGRVADAAAVDSAVALVSGGVVLWLVVIGAGGLIWHWSMAGA